jgi:hypothetical protein
MTYRLFMPTINASWLAPAIWLVAAGAVVLFLGTSRLVATLALALVGAAPILVASGSWSAPEPSLSQRIQRELH